MSTDLSIVIVNYQHLDLLDACLHSIVENSHGFSYEIIVVDNHTTEGDVESVTRRYPMVKTIRNLENRGFSAANNQGFEIACGRYVLMLNNDTILLDNALKDMLDFFKNGSNDAIVGCRLLNCDGSMQESTLQFDTVWYQFCESLFLYKMFPSSPLFNKYYVNYIPSNEPILVDSVKGAFLCAPKSVFDALHGLDEKFFFYAEETDFCYRYKHHMEGKVLYLPFISIIHIGGATTDSLPWFKHRNQAIARLQFYQKHYYGFRFWGCVFFHFIGLAVRVPVYILFGAMSFNQSWFVKAYYFFKQLFIYPANKFKQAQ